PTRFFSCWRLIGVPGESQIRRGDSWQARVLLPHPDPVDQQVDRVVVQDGGTAALGDAPGRHDRVQVLLAGVAQVDAAIVIVVAEKPEPVLVVQRRPFTALAERPWHWAQLFSKTCGALSYTPNGFGT